MSEDKSEVDAWIQRRDMYENDRERKGRIAWKKKWEDDHPWEKCGQTWLLDQQRTPVGQSIFSGQLMAHAAAFCGALETASVRRVRIVGRPRHKTSDSDTSEESDNINTPSELVDSLLPFKLCSFCRKGLPRSAFSTNQATKPSGKCKTCMRTNKASR